MCTAQSSAQHSIRLIHQPIIHFSIIDLFQQFIHPPIFQSVIHPSSNPSSAHPPIHRPPILQTHHPRILQPIIHPSSNPSSTHPPNPSPTHPPTNHPPILQSIVQPSFNSSSLGSTHSSITLSFRLSIHLFINDPSNSQLFPSIQPTIHPSILTNPLKISICHHSRQRSQSSPWWSQLLKPRSSSGASSTICWPRRWNCQRNDDPFPSDRR